MKAVYLSIGSNIEPEKYVPEAFKLLKRDFPSIKLSSIYETEPVGPAGDQKFWNAAAVIQTEEATPELVIKMRKIEESLGRVRSANKYAPRTLDIDILPQEDYQNQAFIMIPLAEIAPQEKDPETGKSFLELALKLTKDSEKFRKIKEEF
jgi:2-amino-4-hydroxy-6-hydroxymethyldihydropteridine diphosphokinase